MMGLIAILTKSARPEVIENLLSIIYHVIVFKLHDLFRLYL